ncbi:hypothetical protein M3Y97_00987400 [Aphelenchoides bicaudatus]|nr:hypothetical protein M3Y97_00987400 [Aphelenchoides bicaudatus]
MDDEAKLRSFIRSELLNGRGGIQTFVRAYRRFGNKNELFSEDYVLNCYTYLDNKQQEKVPSDFLLAMKIVRQEFEKIKKTIIPLRKCPCDDSKSCQLTPLNSRYALDMNSKAGQVFQLFYIDGLYGRKRDVKFNDRTRLFGGDCHLFNIDSQLILVVQTTYDNSSCRLYLFEFDVKKLECTLLDQSLPNFNFDNNFTKSSLKYEDNKLTGVSLNRYSFTMRLMEWEILSDKVDQTKTVEIRFDDSIDSRQLENTSFLWLNNELHVFAYNKLDQVMFMRCDLDYC